MIWKGNWCVNWHTIKGPKMSFIDTQAFQLSFLIHVPQLKTTSTLKTDRQTQPSLHHIGPPKLIPFLRIIVKIRNRVYLLRSRTFCFRIPKTITSGQIFGAELIDADKRLRQPVRCVLQSWCEIIDNGVKCKHCFCYLSEMEESPDAIGYYQRSKNYNKNTRLGSCPTVL